MRRSLLSAILIVSLIILPIFVKADLYIHTPHGSCNRLRDNNEQNSRERDNANRLFDSQDNNRGGYEAPTYGMGSYYFYEQSVLYIEWTAQHSCHNPASQCDFIIQYMCDTSGLVRDGTNAAIQGATGTIPTTAANCINGNCDGDVRYGRHESLYYYQNCANTVMNFGLFHADQNIYQGTTLRGGSTTTRQNNAGTRYGYECQEERDYYPWWRPSPWKDIAIVTNTPAKCAAWQAQSQNKMGKYQCTYPNGLPAGSAQAQLMNNGYAYIPITQSDCELGTEQNGVPNFIVAPNANTIVNSVASLPFYPGVWTAVPSWGIPAPDCVSDNLWMVDNNLGNDISGQPMSYNWTVPSDYSESCVIRMRYNISTADFNFNFQNGVWNYNFVSNSMDSPIRGTYSGSGDSFGWASESSVQAGTLTSKYDALNENDQNNEAPSQVPIWLSYGMTVSDIIDPSTSAALYTTQTTSAPNPTRGYVFQNNPIVDIFGPLIPSSYGLSQQTDNTNDNAFYTSLIGLRLAFNTAQFGRTFQDRTYVFAIRQRPPQLMNFMIHNINVRGKRGNIVQVYPSVEHDFAPNIAVVQNGDLVHFQWQGSEYNNNQNAGPPQGNAGTDDRNNAIIMKNGKDNVSPFYRYSTTQTDWGWPTETGLDTSTSTVGHWGSNVPGYIDDPTNYPFLGLAFIDLSSLAFGGLNSSYFDLGPRQVTQEGTYRYMCTTNSNYSNRSQKGMIVVLPPASGSYQVADWGPSASGDSSTTGTAWTAGAYLSSQTMNDVPIVQQEVWLEAYDNSGYDTPWIKVTPQNISISLMAQNSNPQGVGLYLYIPHSFRILTSPTVWYKMNATTQALMAVTGTSDDGYTTTIPIGGTVPNPWGQQMMARPNQGGFYTVQLTVNAAAIAAIVVSVVAAGAIVGYVYWKVRIQPAGGFQAWLREKKAMLDSTAHNRLKDQPLMGTNGGTEMSEGTATRI